MAGIMVPVSEQLSSIGDNNSNIVHIPGRLSSEGGGGVLESKLTPRMVPNYGYSSNIILSPHPGI